LSSLKTTDSSIGGWRGEGALSVTRVLYVGDDARLGVLIQTSLRREGFQVEQARDAHAGVDSTRNGDYAVAIVDWLQSTPANGLQVGRELRAAAPATGVILCATARRLHKYWRALTGACDDHLTRPFSSRELLARVHRTLARSRCDLGVAGGVGCGPIVVDFLRQSIHVDGREIVLQPLQLRLLGYLIRNAGRAVSHDELRAQVFRAFQSTGSTSIARQICVLRDRLGTAGAFIVTTRGGYELDVSREVR
jgi:two-component system OmpR family response regulator